MLPPGMQRLPAPAGQLQPMPGAAPPAQPPAMMPLHPGLQPMPTQPMPTQPMPTQPMPTQPAALQPLPGPQPTLPPGMKLVPVGTNPVAAQAAATAAAAAQAHAASTAGQMTPQQMSVIDQLAPIIAKIGEGFLQQLQGQHAGDVNYAFLYDHDDS